MGRQFLSTVPRISFVFGLTLFAAFTVRPAAAEFDGRLPIGKGQPLSRFENKPPLFSTLFNDLNSTRAAVYWDPLLDTPRYVSPRSEMRLIEYSTITDQSLIEACRSFVEHNRDFFGVGSRDLVNPTVREVDHSWLVVFQEAAGGIPIRGANIRILLTSSGSLDSVKSFLLRDPPGREYGFTSFEPIAARLEEWKVRIEVSERQLYFPHYDPASLTPVWYVRGADAGGQPWEYFFDPTTGELLEQRRLVWELGEITGKVSGIYPDPHNPYANMKEILSNAAGQEISYPVSGAVIKELNGNRVEPIACDEFGNFSVVVPGDPGTPITLQCRLEYGLDGPELPAPIPGLAWKDGFNSLLKVTMGDSSCRLDPTSQFMPSLVSEPMKDGADWNITFKKAGEIERFMNSSSLLAFEQVWQFMNDTFPRFQKYNLRFRKYFPLTFNIPGMSSRLREYLPNSSGPYICLSPVLLSDQGSDIEQTMTPTMVNHEYAHHLIYILTGALHSQYFDCKSPGPVHRDCIEQVNNPNLVRESQVVEGIADALAAYKAGIPKFGYYAHDEPGELAYDIADPDETSIPKDRLQVAAALWDLYLVFQNKGNAPMAVDLIYRWLSRNDPIEGTNRIFDGSTSMMEEILDALDTDRFTDESDGDRNTLSKYDIWVLDALTGRKFFYGYFIRGDADQNFTLDINDPMFVLRYQFDGGIEGKCLDAMDADGDNMISITDPVYLLNFLFLGGAQPVEPYPLCGLDPIEGSDRFSCWEPTCEVFF